MSGTYDYKVVTGSSIAALKTWVESKAGKSIASVSQVTTSTEDGGDNVLRFTLSDGTTSDFTVRNGSTGSASGVHESQNVIGTTTVSSSTTVNVQLPSMTVGKTCSYYIHHTVKGNNTTSRTVAVALKLPSGGTYTVLPTGNITVFLSTGSQNAQESNLQVQQTTYAAKAIAGGTTIGTSSGLTVKSTATYNVVIQGVVVLYRVS